MRELFIYGNYLPLKAHRTPIILFHPLSILPLLTLVTATHTHTHTHKYTHSHAQTYIKSAHPLNQDRGNQYFLPRGCINHH